MLISFHRCERVFQGPGPLWWRGVLHQQRRFLLLQGWEMEPNWRIVFQLKYYVFLFLMYSIWLLKPREGLYFSCTVWVSWWALSSHNVCQGVTRCVPVVPAPGRMGVGTVSPVTMTSRAPAQVRPGSRDVLQNIASLFLLVWNTTAFIQRDLQSHDCIHYQRGWPPIGNLPLESLP